ncbi:uncharacterized protein LOC128268691 [Anopheles cruzii]|uniref:uncharacterized protein LOC128268691 n=1 Tax=Anopheles cruzii TaxID=68878 RepID=UPI0022EC59D5|nr:uncharacterized protein LOC128268691 [Anopheles cruzii]
MMTRRKSVHESALQAQQQQDRATEDQLSLGAIVSDIANILTPSVTSNDGSCSSNSVSGTSTQSTPPSDASKAAAGELKGIEDKKCPPPSTSVSNLSLTTGINAGPSSSSNVGRNPATVNRSKTPRISKRSVPLDGPVTSTAGSTPTTATQQQQPSTAAPQHGTTPAAPGMAIGPNPVQQTLCQNGMDPDEIPKFKGYRIIEIDHFLQWAAFSQFMHSKHCAGGLLKPYQEYIGGCYSTFAMRCSKCAAIITRSSENYIHHNKLMNRLVKGTVQLGKDYDEMQQFMESLEIPFVTREEFQSIRGQVSSSLEDQSALQRAVEELERASVQSKRKRHGSCKYHYEVLKVYLNKKMKKIEENLQLSVNDSVALAVNAHLKNVSHVQLMPNGHSGNINNAIIGGGSGIGSVGGAGTSNGGTLAMVNSIAGYGVGAPLNNALANANSNLNGPTSIATNTGRPAMIGDTLAVATSNANRLPLVNRDYHHH